MNTLLHFLLCQSYRSLSNVSLGNPHIPFPGLIKKSYHGWLIILTSFEGPLFSLALGPPNAKSTTACTPSCISPEVKPPLGQHILCSDCCEKMYYV